jgi:rod shape-determining protein MreC
VLLLAFVALSIVVITLDFRQSPGGPLERAKDISAAIVAPIQRGISAVFRPVGNFFSSVSDLTSLRSENERLKNELEQAQADVAEAKAVTDENESLRAFHDLDASWLTMDTVTATVIANSPGNYKWAYLIDKGRNDGIRPDMAVIDSTPGLVGKVVRVTDDTATILLLIDPQAAARARVEGAQRYTGVVRGNGAAEELSLEFIDSNASVAVGDEVVTSGYDEGVFPPSIPIGRVTSVSGEGAGSTQDITVEPWVDFSNLDFVTVLLQTGPAPEEGQ